jgi:hypothetical protein
VRRLLGLGALVALGLLVLAPSAFAASTAPTPVPTPPPRTGMSVPGALCAFSDPQLAELSGLAVDRQDSRWAISGSGSSVRVYGLGTGCSVRTVVAAAVDPYDLQDMAIAPDGQLLLADIGDPSRGRSTVAVITLGSPGRPTVHRLRYSDGPHDAKAILLGADGVPLIVTAELNGPAGVYRPEQPLTTVPGDRPSDVVPLRKVGEVVLPASDTQGGPAGGATIITGGATTADGKVAALRTYTDAWLFAAPDGDLASALARRPVRVPLPGEPKGEAIAFDAKGDLLAGSASSSGSTGELVQVPAAAALADGTSPRSESWAAAPGAGVSAPAERAAPSSPRRWLLFGGAGALFVVAVVVVIVGLTAARHESWGEGPPRRPGGQRGRPRPGPPYGPHPSPPYGPSSGLPFGQRPDPRPGSPPGMPLNRPTGPWRP